MSCLPRAVSKTFGTAWKILEDGGPNTGFGFRNGSAFDGAADDQAVTDAKAATENVAARRTIPRVLSRPKRMMMLPCESGHVVI